MAGNSTDAGRSVTSKVIAILMTFSNGCAYSLTEIARLTGLPISTAHRLSTELVAWGMLERTEDGHFQVGSQLRSIATHAASVPPTFHERARRTMEDLAVAASRSVVRLGVFEDLEVAYIEKPVGNRPVSMVFETETMPAHATAMGKALLAFASPRCVDLLIDRGLKRFTPFTLVAPDRLRRALAITRLTRLALSRREYDLHTTSVAAPVFGAGGAVVAALELSLQDGRDLRFVQPPLIVAARSLSRELQAGQTRSHLTITPQRHFDVMMNFQGPLVPSPRSGDE
jgi:IclR family acetate operon transcriptional repressor